MNEQNEDLARRLSAMQVRKLEMEIDALKRDNSFWKRHAPFMTFITVVIAAAGTLAAIWFNLDKAQTEKRKDRELREKEVAEKWDTQYRADLLQLLNYPSSETQTAPAAVFLFQDLKRLVESKPGSTDAEADRQRAAVASLLTRLFASPDFDLLKPHNIELDLIALENWDSYGEHLRGQPKENIRILYNYYIVLRSLRRDDPEVVERTTIAKDYSESNAAPRRDSSSRKFIALTSGYFQHVKFLQESPTGRDENVHRAFCWYKDATGNPAVTRGQFNLDAARMEEWWERCPESKSKGD